MTGNKRLIRYSWLIFTILTICYGMSSFHRTAAGTLAVDIMRDFDIAGDLMAVMGSAFFYPYAVMQIGAGILADRWGAQRTICVFMVIGALGALLFGMASNIGTATAGRVLVGLGMAMIFVPALRIILFWFPPRLHALGTGLLLSLGFGGMLVATWPLMVLMETVGWRSSMLIAAAVTLVLACIVGIFVRNKPEDKGFMPSWEHEGSGQQADSLKETILFIIKQPSYWSIAVWFFCIYGTFFAFNSLWAGPFFIQGCGMDKSHASILMFCLAAGSILGPSIIGLLVSLFAISKRWLLLLSCLGSGALILPMVAAEPLIPAVLLPGWSLLLGLFLGGFGGIALSRIQDTFPVRVVGTATGLLNVYTYLGSAIIQVVSGWLIASISDNGVSGFAEYRIMFILFLSLIVLATLVSLWSLRSQPEKMTWDDVSKESYLIKESA